MGLPAQTRALFFSRGKSAVLLVSSVKKKKQTNETSMFSTFSNPFTDGAVANERSEPEKHTPPNRPRTYNEALISYLERHPSTTEEDIEIIKKEGGDLECLFLWGASEQDIADAEIIAKGPNSNPNNDPNRKPIPNSNDPSNSPDNINNNNDPNNSSNRLDAPETAGEAPSPQPKQPTFVMPTENNNNNNNSRSAPGASPAAVAAAPVAAKPKFVIPSEAAMVTVMDDAVQATPNKPGAAAAAAMTPANLSIMSSPASVEIDRLKKGKEISIWSSPYYPY